MNRRHPEVGKSMRALACMPHLLMCTRGGFGDDRGASLQAPGQQHLGRRLAQLSRYARHSLILSIQSVTGKPLPMSEDVQGHADDIRR